MPNRKGLRLDTSARYEIRIQGYLGKRWEDCLDAITVEVKGGPDEPPVTVVTCEFIDQAALAGALSCLYDMGLPLLSVECIGIMPDTPV
jgi:hypothetical protein